MSEYKHVGEYERQRIEKYLRREKSFRYIAQKLGRGVSCVSEEVRNNSVRGVYRWKKAQHKADLRRKQSKIQCMKVAMDPKLKRFVVDSMTNNHQSPEGISGRLKMVEKSVTYASTKAIYKFVNSVHGRNIEKLLHSKAVKKHGGRKRGVSVSIDGRINISQRPESVKTRLEFGHYEGDFIESGRDGKGSLLVLVERKTRYPFIRYVEDRTTKSINTLIDEMLSGLPVLSVTVDNDISFQKHKELSELINATVFFCDPQAPHQKGTIENRNKAVRRYVPKRCDISQYTPEYIAEVERKLRDRFMKCLNYKTPREVFDAEVRNAKIPLVGGMIASLLVGEKCSA